MQRLLHIFLVAVVLICPYVCCPVPVAADEPGACCCHGAAHATPNAARDKQVPKSPAPCKSGDCLCRGAVLVHPLELQVDHALPCAICLTADDAGTSATLQCVEFSSYICRVHAGPWSTGRELRLALDSLLI
jgi:hypothetical protein